MVFDKVKEAIVDALEINPDTITMESNLREDLDADSIDAVEIIMALEEEFGVEFPDDVAADIKTVKDVVDYIESNK